MTDSMILEESENLSLERIATVRTKRGEEMRINLDKMALAVADLLSDFDNERRFGWTLHDGWIADQLRTLRRAALKEQDHD